MNTMKVTSCAVETSQAFQSLCRLLLLYTVIAMLIRHRLAVPLLLDDIAEYLAFYFFGYVHVYYLCRNSKGFCTFTSCSS
jgi:hypothetical protein